MKRMRTRNLWKRTAKKGGFTLVELLVVIAIIGVLVSLLLPAINLARESGRRNQCAKNIREIADGCVAHDTLHGSFPPGFPVCTLTPSMSAANQSNSCQGPVWSVNVLPQIEEGELWSQIAVAYADKKLNHEVVFEAGNRRLTIYTCPSAERMTFPISGFGSSGLAKGNYAGCWGSDTYQNLVLDQGDAFYMNDKPTAGVFGIVMLEEWEIEWSHRTQQLDWAWRMGVGEGTRRAEIRDGESTTLMISEVLGWDSSVDARGGWVLNHPGSASFMTKFSPNSPTGTDVIPMCDESIPHNDPMHCVTNQSDDAIYASARSDHMNGVNVAFADGATRFINDTVDPVIWQALGTRAGSEIIKPDF